ncbi:hypothetical protein ACJRO7_004654 [Eucalyptus globulus]|uniref:Alpha-ketoglutarate-dependent dioxygenase AlkB-like domain-containing protein n=1 Tax=Eucalyptus globulus TaxID=34317 RepID=A0ABD3J3A7_EUCGL
MSNCDLICNAEYRVPVQVYNSPVSKWKSLKNRRLQNWGGIVHEKGLLPQELPPWLKKVTEKVSEESGLFPSTINHVLINEYLTDQGIMPHQDGPAYYPVVAILSLGSAAVMDFVPHPSLRMSPDTSGGGCEDNELNGASDSGSNKWLNNHRPFSVVLMPRSLLIFKDDAYSSECLIDTILIAVNECEAVGPQPPSVSEEGDEAVSSGNGKCIHRTGTRISLTCRLVLKVQHKLFKF